MILQSNDKSAPTLAVAVASAGDPALLEACLDALETARGRMAHAAPVVVARSSVAGDVSPLFEVRPWAKLVVVDGAPEIPVLRGSAMRRVDTDWVALTEDLFLPDPEWLANLERLAKPGVDVIGGSVGNARNDAVSHAAYLTDYGTFPPERPAEADVPALTGSNVTYGPAVRATAAQWASEGEWEHVIHDRLKEEGATLSFEPSARVDHNATYVFRELLGVRFRHGLQYARDRMAEHGSDGRIVRVLLAPLLPVLMTLRLARATARQDMKRFVSAAPFVVAFYCAWIAGETLAFLKGPGRKPDGKS